ncbi:DUF3085 domain-containing protein [Paraburkholderia aspalathi]|uniref:DUF3085 domain-containing protein n=1 Tax=Paraburkholderia aspalathi TaxID=1324617 RepID=A0A1I7A9A6_9BURK|nr:Protein of unknown function [Paraburkholderia aspalathi]
MLRFKNADLRPVLSEALGNQCKILLVKDHGVYFMSEHDKRFANGQPRQLAYAVGCHPEIDPFDQWYALAHHELGGDDMAEYFDPATDEVFQRIFNSKDDLTVAVTPTSVTLCAVALRRGKL